jgi:hypothetical protein
MTKGKFSLLEYKNKFSNLAAKTDQQTLAVWALDCVERAMPFFETTRPDDPRPRQALDTLRDWLRTGQFSMKVIRSASLGAHAAARDVEEDNPARSAARAAGQTVATAHVPDHAMGGAIYALQAIHRASSTPQDAEAAVAAEFVWQYQRLEALRDGADQ